MCRVNVPRIAPKLSDEPPLGYAAAMATRERIVWPWIVFVFALSTAHADQSVPSSAPSATTASTKRRVIRLDELDRCMGRLVRPLVMTVIGSGSADDQATASFRHGLEFAERSQHGNLEAAANAFARAAADPAHPLHEVTLFELGRVRYRLDDNDGAATTFARVLDAPGGALHDEALRYLALILGDTCAGGSLARARAFLDGANGPSWRIDLWRALAAVFSDTNEHAAAIEANRRLLELAPLGRWAPEAQAAIIRSLDRQRDAPRAAAERKKLAAYRAGGAWYEAHKQDPTALAAVEEATRHEPAADVEPPCNDEIVASLLGVKRAVLANCFTSASDRARGSVTRIRISIEVHRDGSMAIDSGSDPALACIARELSPLHAPVPDEQCHSQVTIMGYKRSELIR
jgi:tetratricopeptide (TPR) repeat protein